MKWAAILVMSAVASAQQIDLSILDQLATRAKSAVNVTLDKDKLGIASAFLNNDEPNQAMAKEIVGALKSITVRVFEFDKPNQFTSTDLDGIRRQLRMPSWSKIVEVKDEDELTEIYMFSKGKDLDGLTILTAEKRELTVVNLVGPVDLKMLGSLAGKFGIPKGIVPGSDSPKQPGKPTRPSEKKEKE